MDSIAVLEGLLERYSPTHQEGEAVAYLVETLQADGFSAQVDAAGNAVGVRGSGPREILLLGHIDTVPGEIPVHRREDDLYGRGAVDAKGPLACFAAAAAQAVIPDGWRVAVIGAVGEEGDSRGARYLCDQYPAPACVVIGEPSGWNRITLGYKGSMWFDYLHRQPLEHTAAGSASACERAIQFWNALSSLAAEHNAPYPRVFDQLSPTLRQMSSSLDGFYETARLGIGLRVPHNQEISALTEQISRLAGEAQVTFVDCIPPYRAEKNTPLVRALLAAVRNAGGQPGFTLKSGTSDMNLVGPQWRCPIVAYGPGDSSLDHTPEEHIHLPEYLSGIQVLTQALELVMKD